MKINASTNGLIAVAICFVVGCASNKQPSSQVASAPPGQPEPGKGLIVFYRQSQFAGGGVPFSVFEMNAQPPTKIVDLSNGRYFAYSVTPGKHRFVGSKSATLPSLFSYNKVTATDEYVCEMNVESNTTHYAHAAMIPHGLISEARLSAVDAGEGAEAIKSLRRQ